MSTKRNKLVENVFGESLEQQIKKLMVQQKNLKIYRTVIGDNHADKLFSCSTEY